MQAILADKLGRSRSFPYRTRHAQLDGGRVAYFDEGQGPALLFVHGLVGDFTHFEHVVPSFATGHRVIGVDLPGCGLSDKRRDVRHSVWTYARAIHELCERLGLERVTLVGHSAGGQVVAAAAELRPDLCERLVLVNSAGLRHYPLPMRWAARAVVRPWLLTRVLERAAMPILDQVFHERNAYTEKFIRDAMDRPPFPLLDEMSKVFTDLVPELMVGTVVDGARKLTMPTLVIWGDRDRLVPLPRVQRATRRLPHGRLEVIRDCGHMPMIEKPAIFIDLLSGFLASAARAKAAPAAAAAPTEVNGASHRDKDASGFGLRASG
jgi:pimeloyl-ACP methyl ester carboxylesterase